VVEGEEVVEEAEEDEEEGGRRRKGEEGGRKMGAEGAASTKSEKDNRKISTGACWPCRGGWAAGKNRSLASSPLRTNSESGSWMHVSRTFMSAYIYENTFYVNTVCLNKREHILFG
jgi:hypothetical protein